MKEAPGSGGNSNELKLTLNKVKTKVMIVDRAGHLPESNSLTCVQRWTRMLRGDMEENHSCKRSDHKTNAYITHNTNPGLSCVWTINADDRRRIDTLEMWAYRRMLRIP